MRDEFLPIVIPPPSALLHVSRRITDLGLGKPPCSEDARVAMPAGAAFAVGVVAGVSERIIDSQRDPAPDDLRLAHGEERRDDPRLAALDPAARAGDDHPLEGVE